MATDESFVEFVADQISEDCAITYRKMFGEYGFHSKGKFVAVACDNKFFVKPTEAGRAYIGDPVEAPPYKGASNYFLIEDKIEDGDWLSGLILETERALPAPKPKKKKKK